MTSRWARLLGGARACLPHAALSCILTFGCTGRIGDGVGAAGSGASSGNGGQMGGGATLGPTATDPGSVEMHRLNRLEYDNTMTDLLGLPVNLAEKTFIPDEQGTNGFDNEADALTMSDAEFEQYFNASDSLAEQVFADATLTSRIVTCTPASATDAACLKTVITAFGLRAYRRPLFDDEVARFQTLASDAVTNGGQDFNGSVKQVVKAILASIPFLYRVEIDADPTSTTPHQVAPYELASRLSYLLWSTMPDAALLADAQSGAIVNDDTLTKQFTRMMQDPRAASFVSSFAGQWLGVRKLASHQVEPTAFPGWSEPLRLAMEQEANLYFNEFLNGDLPFTQFLTAPINFVNGPLAALYGMPGIPATQTAMTKVTGVDPHRIGFMGLGAFLTQSSYSYRTVPTLRGAWVLENLLGETVPPPPMGVPPLDPAAAAATDTMTQEENVRARLLAHRADPTCASCHVRLDPIGLGLENFNGIGAYRSAYGNGQPIDASGQLPDGTMFGSLGELAAIMSKGDRGKEMTGFAVRQLMTYALSRPLKVTPPADTDTAYLTQLSTQWAAQNYSLKALLLDAILNPTFRFRHGGI